MSVPVFNVFDPASDPWPSLADDALHLWLLPHRQGQRSIDALRTCIASYLGIAPDSVELQRSDAGRPILVSPPSGLRFSASHSGELLLLGFLCSDPAGDRIGVDIEQRKPRANALGLARRYFTAHEADLLAALPPAEHEDAFHRLWIAKEALLKALGRGLAHGLDRVGFGFAHDSLQLLQLDIPSTQVEDDATIQVPSIDRWNLLEFIPVPGYRACGVYSGAARAIRGWLIR